MCHTVGSVHGRSGGEVDEQDVHVDDVDAASEEEDAEDANADPPPSRDLDRAWHAQPDQRQKVHRGQDAKKAWKT